MVLPVEDRALPNRAVPQLDKELTHPTILVVSALKTDAIPPPQGVLRVEAAVEESVGGSEEGDWEREGSVEGTGSTG